jgi:hypothetical protein
MQLTFIFKLIDDTEEQDSRIKRQLEVREWIKQNKEHWAKITLNEQHYVVCTNSVGRSVEKRERSLEEIIRKVTKAQKFTSASPNSCTVDAYL